MWNSPYSKVTKSPSPPPLIAAKNPVHNDYTDQTKPTEDTG